MNHLTRRLAAAGLVVLLLLIAFLDKFWKLSTSRSDLQDSVSSQQSAPGKTGSPRTVTATIAPGIHVLNNLGPAAAYVVETSDGLVLVDSGLEANGSAIARDFRYRNLELARLRAILLTHAHADHSQGARQLRQLTGAKIYAGQGDVSVLRAGQPRDAFCSTFDMGRLQIHSTEVDVELKGGETIEIADARFRVIAAPGHTPGSICYTLERDGLRFFFGGDVVMTLTEGEGPFRRELGTYAAYLAPQYRGNAEDFLATIRQLQQLPTPDLVLPGHPRESLNFRITPLRWQSMLDKGVKDMETLVARYRGDGRNFLDGAPKELLAGLYYLGNIDGFAVYCLKTTSGLFLFDAPGGTKLIPFLEARMLDLGLVSPTTTPQSGKELPLIKAVLMTSCGPDTISGLPDLLAKTGCKVIAAESGWPTLKKFMPEQIATKTDRDLTAWFQVRSLPLPGPGPGATAYLLNWRNKQVLVSGRIPIKATRAAEEALLRSFAEKGEQARYRRALQTLRPITPDLWLPLIPSDGQNANLYDDEWKEILSVNERLAEPIDPGQTAQE